MSHGFSTVGSREEDFLLRASQYCFRARLDRPHYEGPVFERAEGSFIWDVEGKRYLDFNAGQLCAALGHNPPRVVEAISRAARTMIHSSSTQYNVYEIQLSEKLASLLPPPLTKSFFSLSGSDASEAAINIAKKVTGRYEIASPHVSFHGLSDTPRASTYAAWHKGMAPPVPGTFALMAPYCFRCPVKHRFPECGIACLPAGLEIVDAETTGALAAIITEPLFSAGGVIEPPPGWFSKLRSECDSRGALLILDESQTGLGKLGTMWGFENEEIIPDVLTISKHFGGGVAISAVVTSEEIEQAAIDAGFIYSHSHSGDPLACAAALAALSTIEEEALVERAPRLGSYWRKHLEDLAARHDCICDIRGRGLLQAIEFCDSNGDAAYGLGPAVQDACLEAGLLFSVRRKGSVIRFTLPFTTTEPQMDQATEILDAALRVTSATVDDDGCRAKAI